MRVFESLLTWSNTKSSEIKSVFLEFSSSCLSWLALTPVLQNSMGTLEYSWWNLHQRALLKRWYFGPFFLRTKYFPSTLRRGNLKTQQSLWTFVWGILGQGNFVIIVTSSFSNSSMLKMSSVHTKTQGRLFKFLWREERFWKAPFVWRISVNGRPLPLGGQSGVNLVPRRKGPGNEVESGVWTRELLILNSEIWWCKGPQTKMLPVNARSVKDLISQKIGSNKQWCKADTT